MYSGMSVCICVGGTTVSVPYNVGLFQGDVLSPLLFLIIINPLLQILNKSENSKNHGILPGKNLQKITNMAYADDVNILARSNVDAQSLLSQFCSYLEWTKCL